MGAPVLAAFADHINAIGCNEERISASKEREIGIFSSPIPKKTWKGPQMIFEHVYQRRGRASKGVAIRLGQKGESGGRYELIVFEPAG